MEVATTSSALDHAGAGTIAAVTATLLAMFLYASFRAAWYEVRARRALVKRRSTASLSAGFGAFHGIARGRRVRPGEELVVVTVTQVREKSAAGRAWESVRRDVAGTAFVLEFADGTGNENGIEVDAVEPKLEGFAQEAGGAFDDKASGSTRRELVTTVREGDEVWITGVLDAPSMPGRRHTVRAPASGALVIAKDSPVAGWVARGKAHMAGAWTAAAAIVALHAAVYRPLDAAVLLGRDPSTVPPLFQSPTVLAAAGLVGLAVAGLVWNRKLEQ